MLPFQKRTEWPSNKKLIPLRWRPVISNEYGLWEPSFESEGLCFVALKLEGAGNAGLGECSPNSRSPGPTWISRQARPLKKKKKSQIANITESPFRYVKRIYNGDLKSGLVWILNSVEEVGLRIVVLSWCTWLYLAIGNIEHFLGLKSSILVTHFPRHDSQRGLMKSGQKHPDFECPVFKLLGL